MNMNQEKRFALKNLFPGTWRFTDLLSGKGQIYTLKQGEKLIKPLENQPWIAKWSCKIL